MAGLSSCISSNIVVGRRFCSPLVSLPQRNTCSTVICALDFQSRKLITSTPLHICYQQVSLTKPQATSVLPDASQPAANRKLKKNSQTVQKKGNHIQGLLSSVLNLIEHAIEILEKKQCLPDTTNPQVQLAGNFFPVPEHGLQHNLDIDGELPEELNGVYVRNGANPMYRPRGRHHLFDGDGMLHAITIRHGTASYTNRFTRTYRLVEEEKLGRPIFPKAIGELHGHCGILRLALFYARCATGLLRGDRGMGVANAGVIFFDGHLLAMSEDDLPYAVHITRSGDLQTLGRYNFHGQFSSSMIAHPKVDFHTGELFGLSYDVIKKPYVKYFKMSRDGKKELEVNIDDVKEPTMIHDFAITENFVIIPDHQVIFSLKEMLKGSSPVLYDKDKVSRFGVLPRNAEDDSDIRWIDVPGCFCFHLWNAWEVEEMNEIVVIGSLMTPADRIFNDSGDGFRSILTEIRLNLDTLTSQKRPICPCLNLEAGQVNRKLLGRKTQYAYLAISQPWPKVSGIAKVNLQSPIPSSNSLKATNPRSHTAQHSSSIAQANIAGSFMFPSNCFGGEPMFVPRCQNPEAEEDDGYVLTFMYNESTGRSELLVLDARSPSLQMIASIKIPTRVPYGFHGTFIRESELKRQKK